MSLVAVADEHVTLLDGPDKGLLRVVTCGSVDDGKSTLMGRLLYDPGLILDDQVAELRDDSRRLGTGDNLDLALVFDGLAAEREQGITIDVAYRYFTTPGRRFIVADAPGHEQYVRNMLTGASSADCAVVLVDARAGIVKQTRRHSNLLALLGVGEVVLAVNKVDLVEYDERRFREIETEYLAFATCIGLTSVTCIPVSALRGDNVARPSARMRWYTGPTLLQYLQTVEPHQRRLESEPFRMPVQWVNRHSPDFRGFSGMIVRGTVHAGERVVVEPFGLPTSVRRIVTYDGDLECAVAGQSVTVTLADEVDVGRGAVIASVSDPPSVAERFQATVAWMSDRPLLRGRSYLMRLGAASANATVARIKFQLDVSSLEQLPAEELRLNDIGACELELDRPVAVEPYRVSRDLGGFVLIDPITHDTIGAGMITARLPGVPNVYWQTVEVDGSSRAALMGQEPCVLWLTGVPSAGKSTIANVVEKKLHELGRHTYLLDGDNVRHGLNRDLGFADADRVENIRRIAEVARLMVDAGLVVIVACISPFRSDRRMARDLFAPGRFIEVFVDTPIPVAEQRDAKGLYARARRGEVANFTGITSPYEPPPAPELRIDTTISSPEMAAELVLDDLRRRFEVGSPHELV